MEKTIDTIKIETEKAGLTVLCDEVFEELISKIESTPEKNYN